MKHNAKRILVMLLAVMLLAGVMLPAALAEGQVVANATKSLTTYAGLRSQLTITDAYGDKQSPSNYTWRSNKTSVAAVSSTGVLTAKTAGTATITATNKYDIYDRAKLIVTVKRNKVNINISKPTASAVSYKTWNVFLKSVEVVTPTRVDVEYYLVCNYPSNWRANKLKSMKDYIRAFSRSTDEYVATIVDGYASTVTGFSPRWGRSVQLVKLAYKNAPVNTTNIRLANYNYRYYPKGVLNRTVR